MKKQLVLAVMAVLTLASCSKETTLSKVDVPNDGRISFRAFSTKGSPVTIADLNKFKVYALYSDKTKFFDDTFTKDDGATSFSSTVAHYWPSSGNVIFDTYAPIPDSDSDNDATNDTYTPSTRKLAFTPAATVDAQEDLLVGTVTGNQADNAGGLDLTLYHALTQIRVYAINNDAANSKYKINIQAAKIVNAHKATAFDLSKLESITTDASTINPAILAGWGWDSTNKYYAAGTAGKADYSTPADFTAFDVSSSQVKIFDEEDAHSAAMIAPQEPVEWKYNAKEGDAGIANAAAAAAARKSTDACYLALKMTITDTNTKQLFPKAGASEAEMWSAVPFPASTVWESNKIYTYILDFAGGGAGLYPPTTADVDGKVMAGEPILGKPIFFKSVTVNSWSDGNLLLGSWEISSDNTYHLSQLYPAE